MPANSRWDLIQGIRG